MLFYDLVPRANIIIPRTSDAGSIQGNSGAGGGVGGSPLGGTAVDSSATFMVEAIWLLTFVR